MNQRRVLFLVSFLLISLSTHPYGIVPAILEIKGGIEDVKTVQNTLHHDLTDLFVLVKFTHRSVK